MSHIITKACVHTDKSKSAKSELEYAAAFILIELFHRTFEQPRIKQDMSWKVISLGAEKNALA